MAVGGGHVPLSRGANGASSSWRCTMCRLSRRLCGGSFDEDPRIFSGTLERDRIWDPRRLETGRHRQVWGSTPRLSAAKRSAPTCSHAVAHSVEHPTSFRTVVGSIPTSNNHQLVFSSASRFMKGAHLGGPGGSTPLPFAPSLHWPILHAIVGSNPAAPTMTGCSQMEKAIARNAIE